MKSKPIKSVQVSDDQNTVISKGVTYIGIETESFHSCLECDFRNETGKLTVECLHSPCMPTERKDKKMIIFKKQ
jgi:hypothetical protein